MKTFAIALATLVTGCLAATARALADVDATASLKRPGEVVVLNAFE